MEPAIQEKTRAFHPQQPADGTVLLWLSILAGLAGMYALLYQAWGSGEVFGHFSRNRLLGILPVLVLASVAFISLGKFTPALRLRNVLDRFNTGNSRVSRIAAAAFWLLWLAFPLLTLTTAGETVFKIFPRIWIFAHLVLAGALLYRRAYAGKGLTEALALSLVVYAGLYKVVSFLPEIQAYPFSLGWSEASRFYYASLFRAEALYGSSLPLPTLHPARYLMQAVPWLVPWLPLWFHRLWQVLLWLGATAGLAALLARRLELGSKPRRILFAVWAALFLFQGPVYYHLAICAAPVLWGFDSKRPWRSLVWVLVGSLWAGISRVNWIPLPAALAVLLYLLETPVKGKNLLQYLAAPAVYAAAGTAAGLLTQTLYAAVSGNPAGEFNSSFSSDLLWNRLLPSATYPLGILPGILVASAALAVVLYLRWRSSTRQVYPIRWLGIAAILGVFFAGGLVVSVKIGGGSNLHNMDAYLLLLLTAGSAALSGLPAGEEGLLKPLKVSKLILGLVLFLPVLPLIQAGNPVVLPSNAQARADLASLQQYLDSAGASTNEVLFITERHLIPFQSVERVKLAPEYEKVFLMEMVMAGNRPYLDKFWFDLKNHRFALIITESVSTAIQDRSHAFSEENNVWVEGVSIPLLESYEKIGELEGSGVWIMAPKK